MLDSSNHSSRSNLFALSSESSQKSKQASKGKKHSYSAFVRKVRHLLEQQGSDLDHLYQKVQVIVRRYFRDNKIVEFGQMYNHLVCLRSNSKKMSHVVALLEQRILEQPNKEKEERHFSDRVDQFSLTTTTQKESKPQYQQTQFQSNQSEIPIRQEDSLDHVTSSVKYQYAPFSRKDHPQVAESRVPKIIEKEEISPIKHSPSKRSSSYEEYVQRNREYNEKVKELMKELTDIKHNLPVQDEKKSEKSEERQKFKEDKEQLVIQLDQSMEIRQQENIIEISPEPLERNKNIQTEIRSNVQQLIQTKIKSDSINQKTQDNASSQQTIGQNIATQPEQQFQRQEIQAKRSLQSGQSRRLLLLEQANLITKQLQELKQVAYLLHQENDEKRLPQVSIISSREQISSVGKIQQQPQQQPKKQILNMMSSTHSKVQPTEQNIPSFKQLVDYSRSQNIQMQKEQNNIYVHPAARQVDSSVFSFSNTEFPVQRVQERSIHQKQNHSLMVPTQHQRHSSRQHEQPLQISVVRKGYNPYFNQPAVLNPSPRPGSVRQIQPSNRSHSSQRNIVYVDQNRRQPHIQNSSAPVMRIQQFPHQQKIQQNRSNRSSSRTSNRSPHLQQSSQLMPSRSQQTIRSTFSYSSPNQNSGIWAGPSQRKGINLISPPPAMY